MKTKLVNFNSIEAIKALQNEEVIAFPTETVYGLACISTSLKAFNELVKIKKRPANKPFTLMGGSNFKFEDYCYLDDKILRVIHKFVPGPITLLLKPKENLPYQITLNTKAIGIRISNSPKLQDFINKVGTPLLVPSANISGNKPLVTAKEVYDQFNGEIPYIIDDICNNSLPSTIIDLSIKDQIKLVRQGELSFEEVLKTYKGE